MINYEKVFNTLKEELKNYINKFHFETIVIGISGGIDSTVPILKKSFAGIRTRNLKLNGLQAIIDVYNKTTKEPTLF